MSNKEIEKIEMKIDLIKQALEHEIGKLEVKIADLKKEDEVEPVLPCVEDFNGVEGYMWIVGRGGTVKAINPLSGELPKCTKAGQTFYSCEDAEKELGRMKARAYVIEAINKANKGDNGFKVGDDNHFIIYSFTNEVVCWDVCECMQQMEGALYIRSSECAQELTKCEEFQANFKAMCGIK